MTRLSNSGFKRQNHFFFEFLLFPSSSFSSSSGMDFLYLSSNLFNYRWRRISKNSSKKKGKEELATKQHQNNIFEHETSRTIPCNYHSQKKKQIYCMDSVIHPKLDIRNIIVLSNVCTAQETHDKSSEAGNNLHSPITTE